MSGLVQSVERAAGMVRLLAAESEPMSLGAIAGSLGLAKGTTHGLLRTLLEVGFVEQDGTGRYGVSADLLNLGSTTLDLNELRSLSFNWMDTLAARTGEATRIAAYRKGEVVVAHHVFADNTDSQVVETGSVLSLHGSALGKVLLAFDPAAARNAFGQKLERLTFRTITDRQALLRELADVRDSGYAVSVGEVEPDLADISAPVRDRGGYVVAAVGISGPIARLCDARQHPRRQLIDDVLAGARSISRMLGHGQDS